MAETRQQVTLRKIRNGLRKQKAEVERVLQEEKDKVWEILNRKEGEAGYKGGEELDAGYYYAPYIPQVHKVPNTLLGIDTTA